MGAPGAPSEDLTGPEPPHDVRRRDDGQSATWAWRTWAQARDGWCPGLRPECFRVIHFRDKGQPPVRPQSWAGVAEGWGVDDDNASGEAKPPPRGSVPSTQLEGAPASTRHPVGPADADSLHLETLWPPMRIPAPAGRRTQLMTSRGCRASLHVPEQTDRSPEPLSPWWGVGYRVGTRVPQHPSVQHPGHRLGSGRVSWPRVTGLSLLRSQVRTEGWHLAAKSLPARGITHRTRVTTLSSLRAGPTPAVNSAPMWPCVACVL